MTNMVSTLDGAASHSGRSGGLGGDGDRRMFHRIRQLPDAVLVGAGTVRAEKYRPLRTPARNGRPPRLVIVTARLDLDPALPCLADGDADHRPLIVTVGAADTARRAALEPLADIVDAGPTTIAATALPPLLAEHGHEVVLCEGGPTLLAQLLEADLVDEWFVTVAAMAIGGPAHRITNGTEEAERRLELRTAFMDESDLLVSYGRGPAAPS